MTNKNNKGFYIKLDKIKAKIEHGHFKLPPNILKKYSYTGFSYLINCKEELVIEISGKFFATSIDIGEISKYNCHLITEKIYSLSGIEIDSDYLFNYAPVFRCDIKDDILVDDETTYYISEIRQLLNNCSDKYSVTLYKDLTYPYGLSAKFINQTVNTGLVIKSKTQKDKTTFNVYDKGHELRKYKNKDFRQTFVSTYLKKMDKTLRFELQLHRYSDMKKFFKLKSAPTILTILCSETNILADLFEKLTGLGG